MLETHICVYPHIYIYIYILICICIYINIYIYIYMVTRTHTPHDPPEPSWQLFVYNTMSPNAFSEVHKPSVFARVSPLHIY